VLGLTFKPNTDDTRDSPAVPLITALTDMGARVRCYDPAGMEQARLQLPDVTYCESAYDAAEDADAVVIATEWEQFRALDLKRLRRIMARPVIVDLRNIYRPEEMRRAKFRYVGIGTADLGPVRRGKDVRPQRPVPIHDRLALTDRVLDPVT
jgi:UDPglucose 6-dehydrogenase